MTSEMVSIGILDRLDLADLFQLYQRINHGYQRVNRLYGSELASYCVNHTVITYAELEEEMWCLDTALFRRIRYLIEIAENR